MAAVEAKTPRPRRAMMEHSTRKSICTSQRSGIGLYRVRCEIKPHVREEVDLPQCTEPVREDGNSRQCKAGPSDVSLSLTRVALDSPPIHLNRGAVEEFVDGRRGHDNSNCDHVRVDGPHIGGPSVSNAQQHEANSPLDWNRRNTEHGLHDEPPLAESVAGEISRRQE